MTETLAKAVTKYYVGVENRYLKGWGGSQPQMEVANSETPQESLIFNLAFSLPENTDNVYLKVVGIPLSPNRSIIVAEIYLLYDASIWR